MEKLTCDENDPDKSTKEYKEGLLEPMKERFDKVIARMKDERITTFAFVMYPEKTPIIEAYRASVELQSAGIKTQMVVANLIIPEEEAKSPFFKNRRTCKKNI